MSLVAPCIHQCLLCKMEVLWNCVTLRDTSHDRGVCIAEGGVCIQGDWADPLIHGILQDMVNKWTVRVLPECILVVTYL